MVGVTGSIPVAPTIFPSFSKLLRHDTGTDAPQLGLGQSRVNRKQLAGATLWPGAQSGNR